METRRLRLLAGRPLAVSFRELPRNTPHRHGFYEPCLVTSGTGTFVHGADVYELAPGDLFVPDAGVVHELLSLTTRDLEVYYTTFAVVEDAAPPDPDGDEQAILASFVESHANHVRHRLDLRPAFEASFATMHATANARLREYLLGREMQTLTLRIMAALAGGDPRPTASSARVRAVLAYIDNHLEAPISVPLLARVAGTSERQLRREVHRDLHVSIVGELQRRRVHRACTLLALPALSVAEVARRVGVPDPAQFSRMFRKFIGISPRQYRSMRTPNTREWAAVGRVAMRTEFVDTR